MLGVNKEKWVKREVDMKLEEKISIHFTELTKTDRKITEQLIKKPEILIDRSVQDAAIDLGVSPAAIMRVIKKLQYKGVPAFKQSLEKYQAEMQHTQDKKESNSFSKNVLSNLKKQLDLLEKSIQEEDLRKIIILIQEAQTTRALGIGSSGLSAEQFVYALLYQDRYMEAVTSRTKIFYLSRTLTQNDVLIIFTVSGNLEAYDEIIEASKKKGAKLIFVTMNHDKNLRDIGEVVIVLPSSIIDFSTSHHMQQLDNRFAFNVFATILAAWIDEADLHL